MRFIMKDDSLEGLSFFHSQEEGANTNEEAAEEEPATRKNDSISNMQAMESVTDDEGLSGEANSGSHTSTVFIEADLHNKQRKIRTVS
ncbi:unnamed protein product [Victoria cruziana]